MKNSMMKLALCLALAIPLFMADASGGTACAAEAGNGGKVDFVAVAYTLPGYAGVVWKIPRPGSYDLGEGFGLPNDSISCIAVAPGYTITLYQHSEFGGESVAFDKDEPDLRGHSHWASSLKVEKTGKTDKDAIAAWLAIRNGDAVPSVTIDPERATVALALKIHKDRIRLFRKAKEPAWYGTTTDAQRIALGGELLKIFSDCGINVDEWEPDTFAQMMNNFFDWRKDLSVWDMACLALNVDPKSFKQ